MKKVSFLLVVVFVFSLVVSTFAYNSKDTLPKNACFSETYGPSCPYGTQYPNRQAYPNVPTYPTNNPPTSNTWYNAYDYNRYNRYYPDYYVLEKGWHTNSNGKYYCKGDGDVFRDGWYWIDGKCYAFDSNGYVYRNRWLKNGITGSWYFVDSDGAAVTGWRHIDDVWYYFNPELSSLYGVMARNTVMYINDMTFGCGFFAFNNEGAIITNSWYGGHYYGSNGVRVD